MNKISFGVRVPNSGPLSSIDNIVKATKAAEDMGFDAVWVHDHVVWSSEMHRHHISSGAAEALSDTQDANFFEATTILSYLAAETKKIVLGVACLVMPCRNPIYAAKQYSTLDILAQWPLAGRRRPGFQSHARIGRVRRLWRALRAARRSHG